MENPQKLITNFSGYEFSSKEIEILKLGLQHHLGVATHPVESEMIQDCNFGRHLGSNKKCESYKKRFIRTAN